MEHDQGILKAPVLALPLLGGQELGAAAQVLGGPQGRAVAGGQRRQRGAALKAVQRAVCCAHRAGGGSKGQAGGFSHVAAGHRLKSLRAATCHQRGHALQSRVLRKLGARGCRGAGGHGARLGGLAGRQARPKSLGTDFLLHPTFSSLFWAEGKAPFAWVGGDFGIRIQNGQVVPGVRLLLARVAGAHGRRHGRMEEQELRLRGDHFEGRLDGPRLELGGAAALQTEESSALWLPAEGEALEAPVGDRLPSRSREPFSRARPEKGSENPSGSDISSLGLVFVLNLS